MPRVSWQFPRILSSYLFVPVMLGFVYTIYVSLNLKFLTVTDSDFLTGFPDGKISRLLGVEDKLFKNSLAESWMGNDGNWHYGPMHVFLTIPLHFFPSVKAATDFLFFLLLALYILSIQFCIKLYSKFYELRISPLLIYAISLFNYPFLSALHQRNLEIVELFIVSLSMLLWSKKLYFQSGMLIGLASGVKYLPAIILLCFIFSRKKKATMGFAVAWIPQLFFIQFFLGWQNSYTLNLLIKGDSETIPLRQGLFDVMIRIFRPILGQNVLLSFNRLILIILLVLLVLRLQKYFQVEQLLKQSWELWPTILTLGVILAPHSNNYYFCLLTPILIQELYLLKNRNYSQKIFFAMGLFLLSAPIPLAILWRVVSAFGPAVNIHSQDASPTISLLNQFLSASPLFVGTVLILILTRRVWKPQTLRAATIAEDASL